MPATSSKSARLTVVALAAAAAILVGGCDNDSTDDALETPAAATDSVAAVDEGETTDAATTDDAGTDGAGTDDAGTDGAGTDGAGADDVADDGADAAASGGAEGSDDATGDGGDGATGGESSGDAAPAAGGSDAFCQELAAQKEALVEDDWMAQVVADPASVTVTLEGIWSALAPVAPPELSDQVQTSLAKVQDAATAPGTDGVLALASDQAYLDATTAVGQYSEDVCGIAPFFSFEG